MSPPEHTITGEPRTEKLLEDILWEQRFLRWFVIGVGVGSFIARQIPKCSS
jgi:hypothetical protein